MQRDYLNWYKLKGSLETRAFSGNFSEREIWWASLGANIGDEEDGKHTLFERPLLVVRKYSKELFLALPLSTAAKTGRFYHSVTAGGVEGVALLSQARAMSSKRLQRRLGRVTPREYSSILRAYADLHNIKSDPQQAESPRAPNGDLYPYYSKHEQNSQITGEAV